MTRRISLVAGLVAAVLAAGAAFALLPGPASAATHTFGASINGHNAMSTCPGGSAGVGSAQVTYNDVTNELSWTINFSGLSGAPTAAHFHGPATALQDAGIQVPIGDLTSPSEGSATISEAQESDLLAGLYYINYHTSMCTGGEIRGQVVENIGGVSGLAAPFADDGSGSSALLYATVAAAAVFAFGLVAGGGWLLARRVR